VIARPTGSQIDVKSLGAERVGDAFIRNAREVVARRQVGRFYDAAGIHQDGFVVGLEASFEQWTGAPHAIATSSGTQALVLALGVLGAGGGEVLLPEYAAAQCALAVLLAGARPILCRPREDLSIDCDHAAQLIGPETRAMLVVHMRGIPSDVAAVRAAVGGTPIIEDCSQFDGLSFDGSPQSSASDIGVFSFQARKVLTAGEGGMLTCREEDHHRTLVQSCDSAWFMRPQYSSWPPPDTLITGTRMNEITAAMVASQLRDIDAFGHRLRSNRRALESMLPQEALRTRSIDWADVGGTAVVECDPHEAPMVRARLSAAGIHCFPESAGVAEPHTCIGWPEYIRNRVALDDNQAGRLLGASLLIQVDPAWESKDLELAVSILSEDLQTS
jgi:8-amino-3,8-dideoxy-alpha-D-manno-octulosonate transaminase